MIKNILNFRKSILWVIGFAGFVIIILTVGLLINPEKIDLPDAGIVKTIEMEQFNEGSSLGTVGIYNKESIETVVSTLEGARKIMGFSTNDYPTQSNYLIVRLNQENQRRTLCLYSENGRYYIEEPYVGIYKSDRSKSVEIYKGYTAGLKTISNDSNSVDVRFETTADIPQEVEEYALEHVYKHIAHYNNCDNHISDAKIISLTRMNTGTASRNIDIQMWLLEYRLLPENVDKVLLAGGMKMEDGWLTEWGSTGQPFLLLVHDGELDSWQRIGVTNTLTVLEEYQSDYTAATMSMYHSFLESKHESDVQTGVTSNNTNEGTDMMDDANSRDKGFEVENDINSIQIEFGGENRELDLNDEVKKSFLNLCSLANGEGLAIGNKKIFQQSSLY